MKCDERCISKPHIVVALARTGLPFTISMKQSIHEFSIVHITTIKPESS